MSEKESSIVDRSVPSTSDKCMGDNFRSFIAPYQGGSDMDIIEDLKRDLRKKGDEK
jgi:hypothetical protein